MKKTYMIIILAMVCSVLFALPACASGFTVGKIRELNGTTYKIGDMNFDGSVTAEDALEILKCVAKINPLDEEKCFIGSTRYEWEKSNQLFDIIGGNFGVESSDENNYYLTADEALAVLRYAAKTLGDESIWYSGKGELISQVNKEAVNENSAWEIADYESYISSMDKLVREKGLDSSIKDKFSEAFFTEKKLVAALVCGLQKDAEISSNGLAYSYKLDSTILRIKVFLPAPPIEEQGAWLVLLPVDKDTKIDGGLSVKMQVEQETWVKDEAVEIDKEKVEVFSGTDMFYDNAEELSTQTPLINVISSYSEYKEYMESVKKDNDYIIEEYPEDYFENHVLVVVGYYASDYSTDVSFYDVRETVLDGKYQINLELKSSNIALPAMRPWIIMIPFEGKDYTAEDFMVEYIGVFENMPWYFQCSAANPVDVDYGDNGFKILSTYEEYQEYIDLFMAANPDYELKHKYSEDDFEYMDVIVGGFGTFSGQLELEYDEAIIREGKMTIYFKGRCPEVYTEDSYYFHYILSYEPLPDDEADIEIITNVEYYSN